MLAPPRNSEFSLRRAAILLSNLDAESRRRLLAHLPPRDAANLRAAAASLTDVDPLEVRRTVSAFVGRIAIAREEMAGATAGRGAERAARGSERPARSTERAAWGSENGATAAADSADGGGDESAAPAPKGALQFLHDVPDATLLRAVQSEHPQTIAVVLASIAPKQAARLLRRLEPSQRSEAIRRLGRLEDVPQEAIDDIGRHLRDLIGAVGELGSGEGRRKLASIFSELGADDRTWLDERLTSSDGAIAAAWADAERSFSPGPAPTAAALPAEAPAEAVDRRDDEADAPRLLPIDRRSAARAGGADETDGEIGRREGTRPRLDGASHGSREPGPSDREPGASDRPRAGGSDAAATAISAEHADAVLERLRPAQLREVLAQLPTRQSLLAVCGLSPRCVRRLLRAMPRRQAKEVRQRLDSLGPLELREVDRAKCAAAAVLLGGAAPAAEAPRRTRAA